MLTPTSSQILSRSTPTELPVPELPDTPDTPIELPVPELPETPDTPIELPVPELPDTPIELPVPERPDAPDSPIELPNQYAVPLQPLDLSTDSIGPDNVDVV